jgi:hypothetical protein
MISDLQNLDLYSIKPTVQLSIATNFDPLKSEHSSLLEEYRSIENIQIKMYDLADRWGVFKDGEVVFLAINGAKSNECAIIESRDNLQIKTLSPLITDVWLRARKI